MDGYGVSQVRAVATSAVREARNGDLFLDRVHARAGIEFEIIDNEAEETRLLYLAVRDSLKRHPAIKGAWTLLAEVGGGSTNITLLRYGQPIRSGVYALGAVRLRQRLDLRRFPQELQVGLLKRVIANVIDEIRVESRSTRSRSSWLLAEICAWPPATFTRKREPRMPANPPGCARRVLLRGRKARR